MKTPRFLLLFLLLLLPALLFAEEPAAPRPQAIDLIDHAPFEALLARYVDEQGMVDYAGWHTSQEDRQALELYIKAIGSAEFNEHPQESRHAFYLNAYNALVLNEVLNRWPIDTVIDIEGFFDAQKHLVAGQDLTLNELEHTHILGPPFQDPRAHFILVCAARDCPRLLRTPVRAATLETQLQAATLEFINRTTRQVGPNQVLASTLFEWYAKDFGGDAGSVRAYLARYIRDPELRRLLLSDDVQLTHSEYDWALNKQ